MRLQIWCSVANLVCLFCLPERFWNYLNFKFKFVCLLVRVQTLHGLYARRVLADLYVLTCICCVLCVICCVWCGVCVCVCVCAGSCCKRFTSCTPEANATATSNWRIWCWLRGTGIMPTLQSPRNATFISVYSHLQGCCWRISHRSNQRYYQTTILPCLRITSRTRETWITAWLCLHAMTLHLSLGP